MTDRLAGLVLPDRTPIDESTPLPRKHEKAPAEPTAPKRIKPKAPKLAKRPRSADRKTAGDWMIVGSGLALAALCAVFPWYIFFNQEDFGTRPVVFGKPTDAALPAGADAPAPQIVGARNPLSELPLPSLDMEATGSVPANGQKTAAPDDQPFPGDDAPQFSLVQVANGRAMVRDDKGYWVVQRGSWLSDGSRVAAIERQDGKWVLVTSHDAIVPLGGS